MVQENNWHYYLWNIDSSLDTNRKLSVKDIISWFNAICCLCNIFDKMISSSILIESFLRQLAESFHSPEESTVHEVIHRAVGDCGPKCFFGLVPVRQIDYHWRDQWGICLQVNQYVFVVRTWIEVCTVHSNQSIIWNFGSY